MALIGTIRKNGWILIALMTLALGGFILMEIISNAQRNSAGDVNTLGKVNGTEIRRGDFEDYEKLVYANAKSNTFQVRGQIWDYFVESALINQEAEALGLGVDGEELKELEFGMNPSPIIADRFKGADGQVNRQQLASIKAAIEGGQFTDPLNRAYWATQEKEIIKERLQNKIITLVTKGMYTPSWQAEMAFRENNERIDFCYVRIPYDKVKDEEAPLTDADFSAYLKQNPHLYDQTEESRVVNYVSFDVLPTAADTLANREAVAKLVEGLRTATNDSAFITVNNGVLENTYKAKAALPPAIADTLLKLAPGTVVGPYLDGGAWTIAKILDRKVVADSARARHILLPTANPGGEKIIDSLQALIQNGRARFDSLAQQNSSDGGSKIKGGDLGWFAAGQMVPEFNAIVFYEGEQGKLYKVQTQFGWHLIEITGKKFIKNDSSVKAAYISQRVEPSELTQQTVKDRAVAFVQQAKTIADFTKLAAEQNLKVETSAGLKANDFTVGQLGAGEYSRDIVQWAFNEKTKASQVSQEVFAFRDANGGYFDSRYVVMALKSMASKGSASVATLKALPEAETKVRNQKKGEILKAKIAANTDLPGLAAQWGVEVDTARGTSMMQAGGEPRILGTVFTLAKDATSGPIIGNSGVYVVKPITEKLQVQVPADLTLFRKQVSSQAAAAVKSNLLNSMKRTADLRDNRNRFF